MIPALLLATIIAVVILTAADDHKKGQENDYE